MYGTASEMSTHTFFFLLALQLEVLNPDGEFEMTHLISRSSVYFRAATPIIKVALSGHLVSRGPLPVSFCPVVYIHSGKL